MYRKEVVYSKETHDFALYMDGELVGFACTYNEAVLTLDLLEFELISGALFRDTDPPKADPPA